MSDESTALHSKYRPKTLDEVIGNEAVVAKLQGIVKTGKWPSAIAFFGPTSAGKTTMARALVSTCLGRPALGAPDYSEVNAGSNKSIDDIRAMADIARLRPSQGKRRFIMIDEAQQLLTSPQAAVAMLKPMEDPPKSTTWIIGSMDPEKFASTQNGRAIMNRCLQFHLKGYSDEDLTKQARRIAKGEGMTYMTKDACATIVKACNGEMRSLANLMQSTATYVDGLGEVPEKLTEEHVGEIIVGSASTDDVTAVRFLTCIYAGKFGSAHREVLNVQDGYQMVSKVLSLNWFLLNNAVLKGERHPKVWASPLALKMVDQVSQVFEASSLSQRVNAYGLVQMELTKLKGQIQTFAVSEEMALSAFAMSTIQLLKPYRGKSE